MSTGQGGLNPAPLNAAPTGAPGVGVQPGATGVFFGRLVIVSGNAPSSGIYVYSPTAAAGDLVASIAAVTSPATQGTDPYGDTVYPVIAVYGTAANGTAGQVIQLQSSTGEVAQFFKSGAVSEEISANLTTEVTSRGGPGEQISLIIFGPQSTVDGQYVYVQLAGSPLDAADSETGILSNSVNSAGLAWGQGAPTATSPGGVQGQIVQSQVSTATTSYQPGAAGTGAITAAWSIGAGDMSAGTTYQIHAAGQFQASGANTQSPGLTMFGTTNTNILGNGGTWPGATSGNTCGIDLDVTVTILTTGSSTGTAYVSGKFLLTNYSAGSGPATAVGAVGLALSGLNTTAATTMTLDWTFAAAPAHAIQTSYSEFIRSGP